MPSGCLFCEALKAKQDPLRASIGPEPRVDPLDEFLEKALVATGEVLVTQTIAQARDDAAPRNEFPMAERVEPGPKEDDLCQDIDGRIVRRDDPLYEEFNGPVHINCEGFWAFIGADEVDPDGNPLQPNFRRPAQEIIDKSGHFVTDPSKYAPLRVHPDPAGRHFIFRRFKDPATGEFISVVDWQVPPYIEVPGAVVSPP